MDEEQSKKMGSAIGNIISVVLFGGILAVMFFGALYEGNTVFALLMGGVVLLIFLYFLAEVALANKSNEWKIMWALILIILGPIGMAIYYIIGSTQKDYPDTKNKDNNPNVSLGQAEEKSSFKNKTKPHPDQKYCPECGEITKRNSKYCSNCGTEQ